jgi:hypothetical protein
MGVEEWVAQPFQGWGFLPGTQGRLEASPTLGFVVESLWDSGGFDTFMILSVCGRLNFIVLPNAQTGKSALHVPRF